MSSLTLMIHVVPKGRTSGVSIDVILLRSVVSASKGQPWRGIAPQAPLL